MLYLSFPLKQLIKISKLCFKLYFLLCFDDNVASLIFLYSDLATSFLVFLVEINILFSF